VRGLVLVAGVRSHLSGGCPALPNLHRPSQLSRHCPLLDLVLPIPTATKVAKYVALASSKGYTIGRKFVEWIEARLADQEEQPTELVGHSEDLLAICGSRMYVSFIDAAVTERLLTEGPLSLLAYLQEEEDLQAAGGGKLRKSILTGCGSDPCMAAVRAMAIICDAVLWPLLRAVKPSAEKHVLDVLPVVWPTALKYFKAAAAAPAGVVDGSSRLDLGGFAPTAATAAQAMRSGRGRLDTRSMERIRGGRRRATRWSSVCWLPRLLRWRIRLRTTPQSGSGLTASCAPARSPPSCVSGTTRCRRQAHPLNGCTPSGGVWTTAGRAALREPCGHLARHVQRPGNVAREEEQWGAEWCPQGSSRGGAAVTTADAEGTSRRGRACQAGGARGEALVEARAACKGGGGEGSYREARTHHQVLGAEGNGDRGAQGPAQG
jgi:hypothetical protein